MKNQKFFENVGKLVHENIKNKKNINKLKDDHLEVLEIAIPAGEEQIFLMCDKNLRTSSLPIYTTFQKFFNLKKDKFGNYFHPEPNRKKINYGEAGKNLLKFLVFSE
jgi:hypothetical protein